MGTKVDQTMPLMQLCLGFIAFEVTGALKWLKIKKDKRGIINITLMASIFLPSHCFWDIYF